MSTKLPVLNARFSDTLPSNGETFRYRPFLVKEEKYSLLKIQKTLTLFVIFKVFDFFMYQYE